MTALSEGLQAITEPRDYFHGRGDGPPPPVPGNVLLFVRHHRDNLQQKALQNRSHHRFVLVYNLVTAGHVHVDHLDLSLSPGQALLVFPFQFHHFSQLKQPELTWLFCTFDLASAEALIPLRDQVVTLGPLARAARDQVVRSWLARQRANVAREDADQMMRLDLARALWALKLDVPTQTAPGSRSPHSLLRRVNQTLAGLRGQTVTIASLAERLAQSESTLRARFREVAGIPLGAYILNHRLNRAMHLLRTSDRAISDIAQETGFGSPQAFSRTFRRETGVSPRSYRRMAVEE